VDNILQYCVGRLSAWPSWESAASNACKWLHTQSHRE
jgi:hypothetical protein